MAQQDHINTLLSIDWDFFFPIDETGEDAGLYDWGHREDPFFINGPLWEDRAAAFITSGKPLPGTSGAEQGFWKRFQFAADARLYVAESHSRALVAGIPRNVISYDAHHDCGYDPSTVAKHFSEGYVHCDDWIAFLIWEHQTDATVIYPTWRRVPESPPLYDISCVTDKGESRDETIDAVFICRSGAWTPPWIDQKFRAFVDACPVSERSDLQDTTCRDFDLSKARSIAAGSKDNGN